jgi:RNA polymerase sigma-70 factor (ECF subfamily)
MEKDSNLDSHINVLISRFCQGDNDAFGMLFYLWKTEFYFFAYSYVKNEQDAEDVLYDCFEKIVKKSIAYRQDKFENESVGFKAFLFKVIKNRALDVLRVKANRHRILEESGFYQEQTSENKAFSTEQDFIINKLLMILKEKEREIFTMYMKGFTLDEIGENFRISKKTVSNVLSTSKEKLRVVLNENHPFKGN